MINDASGAGLRALGMSSFPGFVFVDADGRVVQRTTGKLPAAAFEEMVRSLAPDRPRRTPPGLSLRCL